MSAIYIEAFSGLSGNMFLSAFCALLEDYEIITKLPQQLHLPDAKVEVSTVNKNGISCQYIEVIDLNIGKEKVHGHTHSHDHDHHHHGHHRHLSDIQAIIDKAHISESAKKIAHELFLLIGKAESKIHDIPLEKIHFHEISGVDSIIDIVGNAVLMDKLQLEKVYCTPVCTGFGMVKTQHGMLPIPAPATAELLKGIPAYAGEEKGEKVTPTGAAILKYLNPSFDSPVLSTKKIAYGPGKMDFHFPNVVRVSLLDESQNEKKNYIKLETSIDDMSPEYLGADFQKDLLLAGATDFSISHQMMKKGRMGFLITVLLQEPFLKSVSDYLFENTSTIGLRYHQVSRIELPRVSKTKQTAFGEVRIKESTTPGNVTKSKPEYEDIQKIARASNQSPFQVINKINFEK